VVHRTEHLYMRQVEGHVHFFLFFHGTYMFLICQNFTEFHYNVAEGIAMFQSC